MVKTIKINDNTHELLLKQGTTGDSIDDIISRLIALNKKDDILILYLLTNADPPRYLYMMNSFFWTQENYRFFLQEMYNMDKHWMRNILKEIANEDKWFSLLQQYRQEFEKNNDTNKVSQ